MMILILLGLGSFVPMGLLWYFRYAIGEYVDSLALGKCKKRSKAE